MVAPQQRLGRNLKSIQFTKGGLRTARNQGMVQARNTGVIKRREQGVVTELITRKNQGQQRLTNAQGSIVAFKGLGLVTSKKRTLFTDKNRKIPTSSGGGFKGIKLIKTTGTRQNNLFVRGEESSSKRPVITPVKKRGVKGALITESGIVSASAQRKQIEKNMQTQQKEKIMQQEQQYYQQQEQQQHDEQEQEQEHRHKLQSQLQQQQLQKQLQKQNKTINRLQAEKEQQNYNNKRRNVQIMKNQIQQYRPQNRNNEQMETADEEVQLARDILGILTRNPNKWKGSSLQTAMETQYGGLQPNKWKGSSLQTAMETQYGGIQPNEWKDSSIQTAIETQYGGINDSPQQNNWADYDYVADDYQNLNQQNLNQQNYRDNFQNVGPEPRYTQAQPPQQPQQKVNYNEDYMQDDYNGSNQVQFVKRRLTRPVHQDFVGSFQGGSQYSRKQRTPNTPNMSQMLGRSPMYNI